MSGTCQLILFILSFIILLMIVNQFILPRPYDFGPLTLSEGDSFVELETSIPVYNASWFDKLRDFIRLPTKVLLPIQRFKGFFKRYWLVLLPFLWVVYLLIACCTRCCRCCRCINCLWRPKRRDWYIFGIIWMIPLVIVRLEYAIRHSNDEYFHRDGNVIVIGDSWSVPGKDFMLHSNYREDYALWPHKVAAQLGTKVRGPNLTYAGYRAADWVVEIPRYKLEAKKNDLVIIHLGGNDTRSSIPTVLWLLIRYWWCKFFSNFGWCDPLDYDGQVVEILQDRCSVFISDIECIVEHMLKQGFTRFLISEPPLCDNVPLIATFNLWGILDHNGTDAIKQHIKVELKKLQEKHPENIKIFEEMSYLGEIKTTGRAYIDPVHAGQEVHDKLADEAVEQLNQHNWTAWKPEL